MKKKSIIVSLLCVLTYVILSSNSGGPGAIAFRECTGVLGTGGCGGSGCHGSTPATWIVGTTDVLNSAGVPVTSYVPLDSYTVRMVYVNTSSFVLPRFGYQVTMVKNLTTTNAGTMVAPVGSHTVTVGGVNITEHSGALLGSGSGGMGTTYTVLVKWKAPLPGMGDVRVGNVLGAVDFTGTADTFDGYGACTPLILPESVCPIVGPGTLCIGASIALSCLTPGGTWSSSNLSVATVSSSGLVTSVSPGTTVISYATSVGTATHTISVYPMPAPITGDTTVCVGGTATVADAVAGGIWFSSNPSVADIGVTSGVITGISAGAPNITYMMPGGACYVTRKITVDSMNSIIGPDSLCVGASTTLFNAIPGGSWTSSNSSVASVSSTGVMTGVGAGTSVISYSLTTGCSTAMTVSVTSLPVASISASTTICPGSTVTLTGGPAGGIWISSDTAIATTDATGVITGVATGTASIVYVVANSCGFDSASSTVTVLPASSCVAGLPLPTGIDEVVLYPNPNSGEFSINMRSATAATAHIVISNITGAKVYEAAIKTNTRSNISLHQPAGIYLLSATVSGNHYNLKIVIE